jgi:hypothetical protein
VTSDKQIDANRQNALRSTGPKTPEAKDVVRLNALKHGLLFKETLLPGEDEEALRELGERLSLRRDGDSLRWSRRSGDYNAGS